MPYTDYQPYTMSIRQIAVRRGGSIVELDAAQQAQVTGQIVSGMLRGSSRIVAANAYMEGGEIQFQAGGWPLKVLPIMMGVAALSPSGSTPNRQLTIAPTAGMAMPYFEFAGRADDAEGGSVIIYGGRAKLMSGFPLQIQDGANFVAPQVTAQIVPLAGQGAFSIIYSETAISIADAFPAASSKSISALAISAGIATATSTAHGFGVGQWVTISGATEQPDRVNGLKQIISVADADTFTFAVIGASNDASVSGTIVALY
jgi:hypothetical protein